ncbi:MAG: hypothetical protein WKF60_13675 [Ilumatobacter sp.]
MTAERARGASSLARVEAILANPELYALAEAIPDTDPTAGGRPRDFPPVLAVLFETLISVYGSARQVEAEISHPAVWRMIREGLQANGGIRVGAKPMRRHHYLHYRNTYMSDPDVLARLDQIHRDFAAAQALEVGVLDPDSEGSWTHPNRARLIYGDGKVITPLFKARPGDTKLDKTTGELRPVRAENDADLHFEGTGEFAWGTKWVIMAARGTQLRHRIILDVLPVPDKGGEAAVAVESVERLVPLLPGAQGVVYDTALRGVHHQRIMRDLGLLSINRVALAKAGSKKPRRRKAEQRQEKSTLIETKTITLPDGTERVVPLYARGGAPGIGRMLDDGSMEFEPLRRIRTHRRADKVGTFRFYNDYELPDDLGGAVITIRLHGNDEDAARKLNRTENLRPIPPGDPDFERIFPLRADAESINRGLEDTLYLRRAHSVGRARQHVNLIGWALMVNSLTRAEHRARPPDALAA